MTHLAGRPWVPDPVEAHVQSIARSVEGLDSGAVAARVDQLVARNRVIHERECFNLNPAANVMNPRAEAMLSSGLGSRPSLGYPGDKYEMGLEAIEQIEVLAAELVAEVFGVPFVEHRLGSGAMANLATFMATCRPGDPIVVPPASIAGHVTHHAAGAAGLYGLDIHEAPVDADGYTVDLDALAALVERVRPRLVTIGGSLNLFPHPVGEIRAIADTVGAWVLFDAAHLCGMIAGGVWPDPLAEGAHVMTMSTYKSLGGPPGGLALTGDATLAERLDRIAYPGLTANFDAGVTAALAVTMLDWREHGPAYARAMVDTAAALAAALAGGGLPVVAQERGHTTSHQFALDAVPFGGGRAAAVRLRAAGILTSAIGLPSTDGLRFGTPEVVRWGLTVDDVPTLADLVVRGLTAPDPMAVAVDTAAARRGFDRIHFVTGDPA